MKTKHTPGPWKRTTNRFSATSIIKSSTGQMTIATILNDDGDEQSIANAKLIAAAPIMLNAMLIAMNELKNYKSDVSKAFIMGHLESAIKKATA